MRKLVLVLALGACGSKQLPTAPDPKAFAAMTEEQKCDATTPRGSQCADEILAMLAAQLSPDLGKQIAEDFEKGDRATGKEAEQLHLNACHGDPDGSYADAVFACWAEPDCKALTACIDKRTRRPAKPTPPAEPRRLDQ